MVPMQRSARAIFVFLCAALLAVPAAAAPVLRVERVDASAYPIIRAYVTLVGNTGAPITGLSKENFKVYELKTNEVEPTKVQSLDQAQAGLAVAVVLQTSGTMFPVLDDMKKSTGGFITALGEKDQAAIVTYSDKVETLAPMGDKAAAASAVTKIEAPGSQALLFDGVSSALGLFSGPTLPAARAIIVVSDGTDSGSSADKARIANESKKKRIPIFAIGHSQVGPEGLDGLRELVTASLGGDFGYAEAPGAEDLNKAFLKVKDLIGKQYVVEWKADDIESDKKTYPLEIAVEIGETKLRGSGEVETPLIKSYTTLIVIGVVVLLLAAIGVLVYIKTRPEPLPIVLCPVCKQQQAPEWEVCLFCLKNAQATVKGTKGPATGKTYPLVGKVVKIGKGPENAIKILDPSVSTNHAGIQIDGTKFEIVDLGSSNGTFVNGKKVQRRFLRNGDMLTLGNSEMKFESKVTDSDLGDYSDDA